MNVFRKTVKKSLSIALSAVLTLALAPALTASAADGGGAAAPVAAPQAQNPLRLWYSKPADPNTADGTKAEHIAWERFSLPIGNSSIGASVFGRVGTERVQLNEKSLWAGGPTGASGSRPYISNADPYDYTRFNDSSYNGGNLISKGSWGATLASVQDKFKTGASDASTACDSLIGVNNAGYGKFLSYGNMYLDFGSVAYTNYERWLDLTTAVAGVQYDVSGVHYTREYFVSHPDNVLVTRLESTGGAMANFTVSVAADTNGSARTQSTVVSTAGADSVIKLSGAVTDNNMQFQSTTRIVLEGGGTLTNSASAVSVSGASAVTIYTAIGTDYKQVYPQYRSGETAAQIDARVSGYVTAAAAKGYGAVRSAHIADYSKIFSRVSLDIGQQASAYPTDELLARYNNGLATASEQRELEALLFQYGRYLTIEGSREPRTGEDVTLPTNLQGIWNDSNTPPWSSDYHMNVNLEMNYWPVYSTNMAECSLPLIEYVDKLREPGRVTAAIYAGIRSTADNPENGFTAHTQNTPFGWTCPGWSFSWGYSPAAVPWILQSCWDYYDYTGDVQFLRDKIYPMMKEEAKFYSQYLCKVSDATAKDGYYYMSCPAFSPEIGPRTMGNTYEHALIWQLFTDTLTAAGLVGETDQQLIADWREKLGHLYGPDVIGDSGQIKEWYVEGAYNQYAATGATIASGLDSHRHISHMLGLFPGDYISVDTPQLLNAAIWSMNHRVDKTTGWAMGQRINTWARIGDGDHAYTLIRDLLSIGDPNHVSPTTNENVGGVLENLWDTHAPYQIDGNFGATSGVAEMLLQSNMGYINVLPALPKAWPAGSYSGLVARGGFEVSAAWAGGLANRVDILSKNGGKATVQLPGINGAKISDGLGNPVSYTVISQNRISFNTAAGSTYTITGLPEPENPPVPDGDPALPADTLGVYDTLITDGMIMPGDSRIANHQGANGGLKTDSGGDIAPSVYDPLTIGWFYPEGAAGTTRAYLDALDNQSASSGYNGYLDITVNADRESPYMLNILCFAGDSRAFGVTVNGLYAGATAATGDTPAYTSGAANPTRVLQLDVILKKGANTIRLQAPAGANAPNFMGLAVAQRAETRPILTGRVHWVASTLTGNPDITIAKATNTGAVIKTQPIGAVASSVYDPATIGWFYPDLNENPAYYGTVGNTYSINGLDNNTDATWRGSVTVRAFAPKTDLYNLNIMIECPTSAAGRLYEVTVNGASQGNTETIAAATPPRYTATQICSVLQKPVRLKQGENFIKLQAPSGYNAPAFYAMAVVGYEPIDKGVGDVFKVNDFAVESRSGAAGGWTLDSTGYGTMLNYNPDTIGLFLPSSTRTVSASYLSGLESAASFGRGHVNLNLNAKAGGACLLNILCAANASGLKYEVTANGASQGVTGPASNDASGPAVYSSNAAHALNVLQIKVNLNAGENIIRLQAPQGAAAPDYVSAIVLPYGIISYTSLPTDTGVSVNVTVNSEAAGNLILAGFDTAGRLARLAKTPITEGLKTYTLSDTGFLNDATVLAFVWDDNFAPLYSKTLLEAR